MQKLQNRVTLITGGNAGIGKAAARRFAREGAQVVIAARDEVKGEAAIAAIADEGGYAAFVRCDVRVYSNCERVVTSVLEQYGQIDVLFNNAGVVPLGTILDTSLDVWTDTWATNVNGTYFMCRAALPSMITRGRGVIINNASDWGIVGGHGAAAYATTKGAVIQLTRSLALDHARQGIRVNAICPGDTLVERWRTRVASDAAFDEYLHELGQALPMGRVGDAEEIANAVLFLASDDSSYMTGQLLVVDGGNTAGGASTQYPR